MASLTGFWGTVVLLVAGKSQQNLAKFSLNSYPPELFQHFGAGFPWICRISKPPLWGNVLSGWSQATSETHRKDDVFGIEMKNPCVLTLLHTLRSFCSAASTSAPIQPVVVICVRQCFSFLVSWCLLLIPKLGAQKSNGLLKWIISGLRGFLFLILRAHKEMLLNCLNSKPSISVEIWTEII